MDERCDVGCLLSGYDGGEFVVDHCECFDRKSLDLLGKRLKMNQPPRNPPDDSRPSGLIFRND